MALWPEDVGPVVIVGDSTSSIFFACGFAQTSVDHFWNHINPEKNYPAFVMCAHGTGKTYWWLESCFSSFLFSSCHGAHALQ